jgi:hypothetical protein
MVFMGKPLVLDRATGTIRQGFFNHDFAQITHVAVVQELNPLSGASDRRDVQVYFVDPKANPPLPLPGSLGEEDLGQLEQAALILGQFLNVAVHHWTGDILWAPAAAGASGTKAATTPQQGPTVAAPGSPASRPAPWAGPLGGLLGTAAAVAGWAYCRASTDVFEVPNARVFVAVAWYALALVPLYWPFLPDLSFTRRQTVPPVGITLLACVFGVCVVVGGEGLAWFWTGKPITDFRFLGIVLAVFVILPILGRSRLLDILQGRQPKKADQSKAQS